MKSRSLIHRAASAAALAVSFFALQARADTITFDSAITSPVPPTSVCGGCALAYQTPTLNPPNTFATQGFNFNGFTAGVTGNANTQPELDIAVDPPLCLPNLGVSCVSDGTQYLATSDPFGFFPQGGGHFSISSLDASEVFSSFCTGCDNGAGLANATTLNVVGFRSGVLVADQMFSLTSGFQTFDFTNPNWADVTRVVFQPLTANGGPGIVAIDNINAAPVPEPSTLSLAGLGLAGMILIYRRRRSASARG